MKIRIFIFISIITLVLATSCSQPDVNANSNVHIIVITDDSYHLQENPLDGTTNDGIGFVRQISTLAPDAHIHYFMSSYGKSFVIDENANTFPEVKMMTYSNERLSPKWPMNYPNGGEGSGAFIGYQNGSDFIYGSRIVWDDTEEKYFYSSGVSGHPLKLFVGTFSNGGRNFDPINESTIDLEPSSGHIFYDPNDGVIPGTNVRDTSNYNHVYNSGNVYNLDSLILNNFVNYTIPDYGTRLETTITEETIISYINSLDTKEDDLIFLFVSTHGGTNGEWCFGKKMNIGESDERWDAGYISGYKVMKALNNVSGTKVCFIDTCHSGIYTNGGVLASQEVFKNTALSSISLAHSIGNSSFTYSPVLDYNNVWVMAATTAETSSQDGDESLPNWQKKYGAFTGYLLKGLGYNMDLNKPVKKNSTITLHGIYNYIWKEFPDRNKKTEDGPQIPQIYLSPIDVVLFGSGY